MWRCSHTCCRICRACYSLHSFRKEEEKEMMASIAFIAILIGAAGVAGGIELGSTAGIIASAVIHLGGILGMVRARRMEGDEQDEDEEVDRDGPDGSSPLDKP